MKLQKKEKKWLAALVIFIVFGTGLAFLLWENHPEVKLPVETIRLAAYHGEFSTLIWIAEDQGYFKENGLEVIIEEYDSGVVPVQELVNVELI